MIKPLPLLPVPMFGFSECAESKKLRKWVLEEHMRDLEFIRSAPKPPEIDREKLREFYKLLEG